jgi:hypothetical protein
MKSMRSKQTGGNILPKLLLAIPMFLIVGYGIFVALMYQWSYSDGERAGVLQRFAHKGWVCKTYEGELALFIVGGVAPQLWYFSVRDPAVAHQLSELTGKNVRIHYAEHRLLPTGCFGDTRFFAESVVVVDDKKP